MRYPMKVVVHKTGLSGDTLRAWERRYKGITPERDERGYRVYPERLLEKLILLSILVDQGFRVGNIAELTVDQLRVRVDNLNKPKPEDIRSDPSLDTALEAIFSLDDGRLWSELERSVMAYGRLDMIDSFVFPLIHEVTQRAESESAREVHVRFTKSCVRTFLSTLLAPVPGQERLPKVVLAYTLGQSSDIGGVASAVHAQAAGWHPVLLGESVPAEQIVQAVDELEARAVVLAAVSDTYDTSILTEMSRVRRGIPDGEPLYFGGRMPDSLVRDLERAGLVRLKGMTGLRTELERLARDDEADTYQADTGQAPTADTTDKTGTAGIADTATPPVRG